MSRVVLALKVVLGLDQVASLPRVVGGLDEVCP